MYSQKFDQRFRAESLKKPAARDLSRVPAKPVDRGTEEPVNERKLREEFLAQEPERWDGLS